MRSRAGAGAALAAVALTAWATGCRAPAEQRYSEDLAETTEGAAHAVHQRRLQEVMRSLDALRSARMPTSIDPLDERRRRAREVSRVASAMAEAADRIPEAAPAELEPAERAEFAQLAEGLARLCRQLAADAATARPQELDARLGRIDATCERCHERFRIPGLSRGDD